MGSCPLCGHAPLRRFYHRGVRDPAPGDYLRCPACALILLTPRAWPDLESEQRWYHTHENDPEDPGYRRFLQRLTEPLTRTCPPPAAGLDWGSGPRPALATELRQRGYAVALYDPVFGPTQAPGGPFDFITCTEALEHFHRPLEELHAMQARLRPGGTLAIMSGWPPEAAGFHRWHYRRDPTHVAFYGPETLRWIARRFGWDLQLPVRDVVLFRAPPSPILEER